MTAIRCMPCVPPRRIPRASMSKQASERAPGQPAARLQRSSRVHGGWAGCGLWPGWMVAASTGNGVLRPIECVYVYPCWNFPRSPVRRRYRHGDRHGDRHGHGTGDSSWAWEGGERVAVMHASRPGRGGCPGARRQSASKRRQACLWAWRFALRMPLWAGGYSNAGTFRHPPEMRLLLSVAEAAAKPAANARLSPVAQPWP